MAQHTTGKCLRAELRDEHQHMVGGQAPVRRFHVAHNHRLHEGRASNDVF